MKKECDSKVKDPKNRIRPFCSHMKSESQTAVTNHYIHMKYTKSEIQQKFQLGLTRIQGYSSVPFTKHLLGDRNCFFCAILHLILTMIPPGRLYESHYI